MSDEIDGIDIAAILNESRFKHNLMMEAEYRSHITSYRRSLKKAFPDQFNWDFDGQAIIEMAQCLIEVDYYNSIVAEAISKKEIPPGWIYGARKKERDALFKYRKDLVISIESRVRRSGMVAESKTTAAEDFTAQYS